MYDFELNFDLDGDGTADSYAENMDLDGDGSFDSLLIDSDGDGVGDVVLADMDTDGDFDMAITGTDLDNDGDFDQFYMEMDTNNDGSVDAIAELSDANYDGTPDYAVISIDQDGDGYTDYVAEIEDVNGNMTLINEESILDSDSAYVDTADDVNVFVPDESQYVDVNGDGINDTYIELFDMDGDGTSDYAIVSVDADGDGDVDYTTDLMDSNDDGIFDFAETAVDTDGDGELDYTAELTDSDGDGSWDFVDEENPFNEPETPAYDSNHDASEPEYVDTDGDGVADALVESFDEDGDGDVDYQIIREDTNDDGIVDSATVLKDTNDDGIFDFAETAVDTDGDGVADHSTQEYLVDSDGDGTADTYILQVDKDGDGVYEAQEVYAYDDETGTIELLNLEEVPQVDYNTDTEHYVPTDEDGDGIIGDPEASMEEWEFQGDTMRCALYSQKFIIEELTDYELDIEEMADMAEANGWFSEQGGTPLMYMNKMLDTYGVDNEMSFDNDMQDIEDCLENGGKVIVSVDSGEIWFGETDDAFAPVDGVDHAVQVIGIDTTDPENPMVILNDSGHPEGCGEMVPMDVFVDAWSDGNCQMIACY